jgi:hypothetical protein
MEEVNEELRQQKLEAFWKENRSWIIASVILAILATAGITYWRNWDLRKNLENTAVLLEVSKADDPRALTAFADTARKNHAALARFLAAGLHVKEGNAARAIEIYDSIGSERGLDRSLRDLARILSLSRRLETGDPKKLHAELANLSSKKSPYRFSAIEMDALVYAREGKMKEAAERLEDISTDASAPNDARMRATTLHEFYAASAESAPPGKDGGKGKTK